MLTQTQPQQLKRIHEPVETPAWLDRALYPFQSRFIEIEGERIHYIDEGAGPTLLFLHANPLWSFTYRDIIKDLRGDFRCIALDYPGFGLSGLSDEYVHTLTANSRLVERFIEALRLTEITLYAHDASCSIGLGVVGRRPEWFRAAVVSNSFAWPIDADAEVRRFVKVAASAPFGFMISKFNMLISYMMRNVFFADGRKLTDAEKAAFQGPFADSKRRRVQQEFFRSILNSRDYLLDLEARLRQLPALPVMVLFGDDDATYKAGWVQRFEQLFPQYHTVILEGGHHFPSEYDPQRIVNAIRKWYATLD
jgi:haloalkane dehalogenase